MNRKTQYQQNIDIIKNFFAKPIVLIAGIMSIVTAVSASITIYLSSNTAINIALFLLNKFKYLFFREEVSSVGLQISPIITINLFMVLSGVIFILLFSFGKSTTNKIIQSTKLFKILSVIEFIFSLLLSSLIMISSVFIILLPNINTTFKILLLTFSAFFVAFLVFFGCSKLNFAKSVNKSINTIYLYNSGSSLFGILNLISAFLNGAILIIVLLIILVMQFRFIPFIPFIIYFLINCANNILWGILAIKYNKYIKSIKSGDAIIIEDEKTIPDFQEKTEEIKASYPDSMICYNCGNPLTNEDIYCNLCGAKIK